MDDGDGWNIKDKSGSKRFEIGLKSVCNEGSATESTNPNVQE